MGARQKRRLLKSASPGVKELLTPRGRLEPQAYRRVRGGGGAPPPKMTGVLNQSADIYSPQDEVRVVRMRGSRSSSTPPRDQLTMPLGDQTLGQTPQNLRTKPPIWPHRR